MTASAQSPRQIENYVNSSKKVRKNSDKTPLRSALSHMKTSTSLK